VTCGPQVRTVLGVLRRYRSSVLTLFLSLSTPNASAQDGGIEVFAAGTLFASGTRVSLSHIYESKGSFMSGSSGTSDPLDQELVEQRAVLGIDHGLLPDLTLSALIPWVSKDLDSNAGGADSAGLGDVALLGKWRIHKRDWNRGARHVSLIGGIELPTGVTNERGGGSRLAPEMQPGAGAWNPFFGVSTNLNLDRLRFDAQAFYKFNTEGAQDHEKGDFFALSLDGAYRFYHAKYPGPSASAKLGLQWRYQGRSEEAGVSLANSGSDELRLRSGLSWHPLPNIDISFSVEIPLYQDFNGEQLGLDYRTFTAIGIRF